MHYTIMLVTICNISLISLFFLDGEILDVWNRYFFGVSPIIKPVMQRVHFVEQRDMVGSIKRQESFNWCFCISDIAAPRTPFSLSFSWIYGKLLYRDLFMYFTISHDSLSTFFWHAWFPYWYDIVSLQFCYMQVGKIEWISSFGILFQ